MCFANVYLFRGGGRAPFTKKPTRLAAGKNRSTVIESAAEKRALEVRLELPRLDGAHLGSCGELLFSVPSSTQLYNGSWRENFCVYKVVSKWFRFMI